MTKFSTKRVVFYATPYRFTDKETGMINEGVTFYCYDDERLKPFVTDTAQGREYGRKPIKVSLSRDKLQSVKMVTVPAIYEFDNELISNDYMRPQLSVVGVRFVSDYDEAVIADVGGQN